MHARRQTRCGQYHHGQAFCGLHEILNACNKGMEASIKKLAPTNKELMEVVNKEYKTTMKGSMADKFRWKAVQISVVQRRYGRTIAAMMKD